MSSHRRSTVGRLQVVAILGYGSHGRDIEAIWNRKHGESLRVYDDQLTDKIPKHLDEPFYIGANNPSIRRSIAERVIGVGSIPLFEWSSVHDLSSVKFGLGSVIAPNAFLLCEVETGDHVHINYGASMTRCSIGSFTTICPGATICGDVTVGEECLIGANATICDRVTIGDRCTIAAGSIIPPESIVPDDSKVIGVWK